MKEQVILSLILLLLGSPSPSLGDSSLVSYPEGYRTWTHVKSMVIQQGHPLHGSFGGIHHIYANSKALDAMRHGKSYPDGSVIVFDLLEAKSETTRLWRGRAKS